MTYERLMEHAEQMRRDAIAAVLAGIEDPQRYRGAVEHEFSDVPAAFEPISGFPDPARFDAMVAGLDDVLSGLSTGDGGEPAGVAVARFGSTMAGLRLWTGAAAERFRAGFAEPWPALVRNQYAAAAVLRSALVAQQDLWARARSDADQIAEQGLAALAACGECTRTEWTVTFTVVASVAAVAVIPLAGSAAFAVGGVGALAQVAAAGGPAEAPRGAFAADDPGEVVARVREAIGRLRGYVAERRAAVAKGLRQTRGLMADRPELFG